jgi:hypothetical protein
VNFPTVNPLQSTYAGFTDVFVTKFEANGSAVVYSTYLGGSSGDDSVGLKLIAVDEMGSAYVTGATKSTNFPLVNPLQPALASAGDAFVTMIRADGSGIVYSTYLGGGGEGTEDRGNSMALDTAGNVHVTGQTFSADFPTQNPLQPSFAGAQDAFVAKIRTVLPPVGLANVSWSGKPSMEWSAVPGATNYHLYRGGGADLPRLLDTTPDSCLRLTTSAPSSGSSLTEEPAAGSLHWYLVRAENENGMGTAGNATAGPRVQDSSGSCQ